tara:strand:- start:136 stop:900 length:765 start_codon:yes stop_codon:yes gene_type:complete
MKKIICILFILVGCAQNQHKQDHLMMSTLWMQQAGEFRALTLQAYNAARSELYRALKRERKKPAAIILDVDETVLDNSPYQARMITHNRSFEPDSWDAWVDERNADAVAGAIEFLKLAKSKGVEIFYVTNRPDQNREATYDNLVRRGFPVKRDHVQTKGNDKSKQDRRNAIIKKHDVIMLIGDNLGDFNLDFFDKDNASRRKLVDKNFKNWGRKFIVLPNPMYGDWENEFYKHDKGSDRSNLRRKYLRMVPVDQ